MPEEKMSTPKWFILMAEATFNAIIGACLGVLVGLVIGVVLGIFPDWWIVFAAEVVGISIAILYTLLKKHQLS